MNRLRHPHLLTERAAVGQQTHELLCVEGIAACLLQQRLLRLGRQHRPFQQRRDQLGGVQVAQRSEVDPLRVSSVATEARMPLVQLRPRCTEE